MEVALILGKINTAVILGLVFYLIIFPIGIVFRLLKIDPLKRSFEKDVTSYRINAKSENESKMENPY